MKIFYLILFISFSWNCRGQSKSPDPVVVNNPSSVSTKVDMEEAVVIILTKEGKVYLMLGDLQHRAAIINNINKYRNLGLNEVEKAKLKKMDLIGIPLNMLKSTLDLNNATHLSHMPGIPASKNSNNELVYWIKAITNAFKGDDIYNLNLLVKADHLAKYTAFEGIKQAMTKNGVYKFRIVTTTE